LRGRLPVSPDLSVGHTERNMQLKVKLVWQPEDGNTSSSIYLTSDGKILLEGSPVGASEREKLSLSQDVALIKVDRHFIDAVKTLL
jgi:hypothetical protein